MKEQTASCLGRNGSSESTWNQQVIARLIPHQTAQQTIFKVRSFPVLTDDIIISPFEQFVRFLLWFYQRGGAPGVAPLRPDLQVKGSRKHLLLPQQEASPLGINMSRSAVQPTRVRQNDEQMKPGTRGSHREITDIQSQLLLTEPD